MGVGRFVLRMYQSSSFGRKILLVIIVIAFVRYAVFYRNRLAWALLGVLHCCVMSSGQMYNVIRSPLYHKTGQNGPEYVKHGFPKQQFVAESYAATGLYVAMASGMIVMIEAAGGVKNADASRSLRVRKRWRQLAFVAGMVLHVWCLTLLLSMLKMKRLSYPYTWSAIIG